MFKSLPQNPDFPELERNLLQSWQKNDIINRYLHKNDRSDKKFSFVDGPITANGLMGVHHARGRALKDLIQRYQNAKGFAQRFQNGFDCQGLWVEVEVEKEKGFNSKKDILDYGIANFTQACLDRVNKYAAIQTEQSQRLGYFMDWQNSYYTNSKTNNLYIWHFLKTVWQKDWLTKRKSAATWCPRCETGLSQHEEADGYKEITDTSVYLKLKLSGSQSEYILAWTTTPWTLAANVLLAINTEFEYVKANLDDSSSVYLAKQAADRLGLKNYQSIDASKLLNKEYESVYKIPAQQEVKHYIVNWDQVDPAEGTGVVHIAPGCGQEDFELGKKLQSDMIAPLDSRGYFIEGFDNLTGKYAHDVAPLVFEYLQSQGLLYKTEAITHRYPHCWRCHTKCLFRLEDSWFIKSDEIRPHLKEAAAKVIWHPKYAGRRMQNWLDTMEDWMINRKRFYGLALPFYECQHCRQLTVVGSLEELKSLALKPQLVDSLPSLHRPWIDDIEIRCPHCQNSVKRIPDVGDVWLDAGVVPFSTLKYLEDKQYWQQWFPADLVSEMTEQIRLWFYSMLFFSVTFEGSTPYKEVVTYSEVRDENGDRMSKTKKNGIPFDEAVEKMGADAMRWLYFQQKPPSSVNFGYNIADQVKRDFILILWNSYRFFSQHASNEAWEAQVFNSAKISHPIDSWILSRLNTTISRVTKYLDKYNTASSTKEIESLVGDLSTWYIRRNRDRVDNFDLLFHVFDQITKLIAPFTPFLSDLIYTNLHNLDLASLSDSVHLQSWPEADGSLINSQLENQMILIREICRLTHARRQIAQIKLRQPLNNLIVKYQGAALSSQLEQIIKDETNVKNLIWQKTESGIIEIELDTTLTPELIEEGEYRDLVRSIQLMRKEQNFAIKDRIKIFAPSWPQSFETDILAKTLADTIQKSDQLRIEKI